MASRLELHRDFCTVLGNNNVYFNPPESVKMQYDAIRYSLSGIDAKRASNTIYNSTRRYEVTAIVRNADSDIVDKMLDTFSMCSFDRSYTANNLYHFVFILYY